MASRRKRFFGAMCDSFISLAIMIPIMSAMGIVKQVAEGENLSLQQTLMLFIMGWIVFIVLHGYLLATQGQTIGKRAVGTRIVGLDGRIPSLSKVLCLRYMIFGAIGQIPVVGGIVQLSNVLCIFGKDKQCMHDKVASTLVIDSSIPLSTIEAEVIYTTEG